MYRRVTVSSSGAGVAFADGDFVAEVAAEEQRIHALDVRLGAEFLVGDQLADAPVYGGAEPEYVKEIDDIFEEDAQRGVNTDDVHILFEVAFVGHEFVLDHLVGQFGIGEREEPFEGNFFFACFILVVIDYLLGQVFGDAEYNPIWHVCIDQYKDITEFDGMLHGLLVLRLAAAVQYRAIAGYRGGDRLLVYICPCGAKNHLELCAVV